MTTIPLPLPLSRFAFDRGLSSSADQLREHGQAAGRAETSVVLSEPQEKLEAALAQAWEVDADVEPATHEYARSFLNSLPLHQRQAVDIQIDPSGEVMFEWAVTPRWILTLTINERGRIAYSGIYGSSRTRGMESFEGAVPSAIALAIARLRHI
jgi:hypothetical protein